MLSYNEQVAQNIAQYYQAHKEYDTMKIKSVLPVVIIAIYFLIAIAVSTNIAPTF